MSSSGKKQVAKRQKQKGPNGRTMKTASTSAASSSAATNIGQQTQVIQSVGAQLVAVFAVLSFLSTLPATARRNLARARSGWEPLAASMAQLVLGTPALCPVGLDPQALLASLDNIAALQALEVLLAKMLLSVSDTLLVERSGAYKSANDIYNVLLANARTNPSLNQDLAAFEAYLAKQGRKKPASDDEPKSPGKAGKGGASSKAPASGSSTGTTGSSTGTTGSSSTGSTTNGAGNSVPVYGPNGPVTQ